jgi:D-arabinan exo alpha-(1,3)/(1,5)-arabinofuranosidase (non-reducing end)
VTKLSEVFVRGRGALQFVIRRWTAAFVISVLGVAQAPDTSQFPLSDLTRMKSFSAHRASSGNRFVGSNDDSKRIMPGETHVMADLPGPGIVNHIWLTVADNEFAWPRLLRLRVYYDGEKTPSVDVPLGDFFGVGHGYERNLDSFVVRDTSFGRARNSYWPMPFRKSCKITVTDEGKRPVTMFYYHVDWQQHQSLPDDVAYFHGYYRQERPATARKNYEFLSITGAGHYVGTVLNVIQSQVGWFGEGDDLFYVDGAQKPQIYGTGTEDYINEAWGLRVSSGLWFGTPVAEGERIGARLTGYRWHVPDPIPFTKSIWVGIEHAGWTYNANGSLRSGFEERPDYFSSAAFWYQKDVNEGLPEPPYGEARLPLGNAQQIAVEDSIKEVTTAKGKAVVQREVDWGKDLLFFEAQGQDSRINIPIDVPANGRYEILARIAQAPDYGDYIALLDDKPTNLDNRQAATSEVPTTGSEVFHNFLPEIYVAVDHPLGWLELSKGRHILSFDCVGKDGRSSGYNFGLNDVVLERVPTDSSSGSTQPKKSASSKFESTVSPDGTPVYRGVPLSAYLQQLEHSSANDRADTIRSIGAFGEDGASAVHQLATALRDRDVDVRVAAAWAFSQVGPRAAPEVSALEKSLTDSDATVRSLSAVALRSIGLSAKDAIPALISALKDPAACVRAPAAEALGNMGASAKMAVKPLSESLLASGQETFVLRSVATALGNIGPEAASGIPALQRAMSMHRVTGSAQEAILKINQEPVQTWY